MKMLKNEDGNVLTKFLLFFLFSALVYSFTTSFTNTILPKEASQMVGAFFGLITFCGCVVFNWILEKTGRKGKR